MLIHTIIEDKSGMSLRIYKNVKLAANDAAVYSTQCLWPHRKPILTAIYPKIHKNRSLNNANSENRKINILIKNTGT